MFRKKSQSSMEFLLTFAIGITMILMLSAIFLSYSGGAKQGLDKQQIERVGQDIMFNVEKIYFLGSGNRLTMKVSLPDDIVNMTIYNVSTVVNGTTVNYDYLNISYYMEDELISNIFTTKETYTRFSCTNCYREGNISFYNTSDFAGGSKRIRIQSKGSYVSIDFLTD